MKTITDKSNRTTNKKNQAMQSYIRRIAIAILFGILSIWFYDKLGDLKQTHLDDDTSILGLRARGREQPILSSTPPVAVPIWRNKDLSFTNKIFETTFPMLVPLRKMTKCSIEHPQNKCLQKSARQSVNTTGNLSWLALTNLMSYTETIISIPRHDIQNTDLTVRLLVPSSTLLNPSKAPLVLWIHGGGFTVGDAKDGYLTTVIQALNGDTESKDIAQSAIWASVDYRLAPEHPYPAAPEDCFLALQYMTQEYKFGEDHVQLGRIGGVHVAGTSAGATLAAGTVLRGLQNGIHIDSAFMDSPVLAISPHKFFLDSPSYYRNGNSNVCPQEWIKWSMAAYAHCQPMQVTNSKEQTTLSPCSSMEETQSTTIDVFDGIMNVDEWKKAGQLPPLLLVTAKADPLHDGGIAFMKTYRLAASSASTSSRAHDNEHDKNDILKHVDASASHVSMFMFDSKSSKVTTAYWSQLIRRAAVGSN